MKQCEVTLFRQPGQWERQLNPLDCEAIARCIAFFSTSKSGHFVYKDSQTDEVLVDCHFKYTKNFCTLEYEHEVVRLAYDRHAGQYHDLRGLYGTENDRLDIPRV